MMAEVLPFYVFFLEKDPHFNAVELGQQFIQKKSA